MKDIKIVKIERLQDYEVPGSLVHNYVLHYDTGGYTHISIEQWCKTTEDKLRYIDISLSNIQHGIFELVHERISNLMDISKELKEMEGIWNA